MNHKLKSPVMSSGDSTTVGEKRDAFITHINARYDALEAVFDTMSMYLEDVKSTDNAADRASAIVDKLKFLMIMGQTLTKQYLKETHKGTMKTVSQAKSLYVGDIASQWQDTQKRVEKEHQDMMKKIEGVFFHWQEEMRVLSRWIRAPVKEPTPCPFSTQSAPAKSAT